ncbi:probable cytochrome P450 6d5 [Toxorhynchites rutilus septentrionalis]|uniref:probable cytochrome P450 6d5 n=1 Tax=Toxorhynchites rutilus septentrionalis TaxID=329112 RepID=UPI00247A2E40|nr:probable cytochrome P450 6d5 [Toxorhynchites rutilus septentrionalis]
MLKRNFPKAIKRRWENIHRLVASYLFNVKGFSIPPASRMIFTLTFALLAVVFYLVLKYIYSYWDRHGLPNLKPHIPFGNLKTVAMQTESIGMAINSIYWKTKGQLVGIYLFFRPAIMIRDAQLAHRIMTEDFNSFRDRGVYCDEEGDPFSAHLFALAGKQWKHLRNKLTPTFTSGQLRNMLPTILGVGVKLQNHLRPAAAAGEVMEMRDMISRFVLEIIATVFFGFEANCIHDPNDSFRTVLGDTQRESLINSIRSAGTFICPGLFKIPGIKSLDAKVIELTTNIVTQQIENRERSGVTRRDFIQQLIDLRQEDTKNGEVGLSVGTCAANVFLFYVAGTETTAGTISFTLYELCQQPDLMARLQTEIDLALKESMGGINYDVVARMRLLDLCVKETLRKYPGLPILNRECTQDYKVSDSEVVIKKGTQVIIPIHAYSADEKYFPDPDRYHPKRFDPETKSYDENAYAPFGEGPRNCIGIRMGVLVTKICLVMLLSKFNFATLSESKLDFSTAVPGIRPKDGIRLKIETRHIESTA